MGPYRRATTEKNIDFLFLHSPEQNTWKPININPVKQVSNSTSSTGVFHCTVRGWRSFDLQATTSSSTSARRLTVILSLYCDETKVTRQNTWFLHIQANVLLHSAATPPQGCTTTPFTTWTQSISFTIDQPTHPNERLSSWIKWHFYALFFSTEKYDPGLNTDGHHHPGLEDLSLWWENHCFFFSLKPSETSKKHSIGHNCAALSYWILNRNYGTIHVWAKFTDRKQHS